jgi:phytoene synthase
MGGQGRLMARKTSFYYAFLVLPPAQRRAIVAVWDFCRVVDDAVDEWRGGAGAIAFWTAELARCYDPEGVPETQEGRQLRPHIQRFDLPRQAFEDVIAGVAMDLERTRYQTFDELYEYCRRVAAAVGLICIRIFGCRDERAEAYAINLGLALQLTNILRDVNDDLDRGRIYLPLEDLATAGCSVDDLTARRFSPPVRRLIELECRRARDYYANAVAARPARDRRRLVAAEIMRAVYFETLRRIERVGYDVFSAPARVPRPMQALIALRQWLWQT